MKTCTCIYHSSAWAELVEQGWITVRVEHGNIAYMIYQPRRA